MRSEFQGVVEKTVEIPPFSGGVAEIAHEAGVTRQWLNKLVDQGKVPGVRRGRTGRLEITDHVGLRAWIFQRRLERAIKPIGRTMRAPGAARAAISHRTRHIIEKIYHEHLPVLEMAGNLPLAQGLKIVHADQKFTRFRCFPLFEWLSSARTHRSHELRESVFLYKYQPDGRLFDSLTEIAKKHGVTRAAVSKVFGEMMRLPGLPRSARDRKATV